MTDLFFRQLFYLVAVLDLVDKDLSGLKTGDIVLVNHNSRVTGDIAGNFFLSLFVDKASKSTDVDILSAGHRSFNNTEESFHRGGNIGLVNSGFFSDLVDNVCLGHVIGFLGCLFFSGRQI